MILNVRLARAVHYTDNEAKPCSVNAMAAGTIGRGQLAAIDVLT